MDTEKTFIELVNPSFTFKFNSKEYQVKKANIEQVAQYQIKLSELAKDDTVIPSVRDLEVISYCVYLLLKTVDTDITVDIIKQQLPGNVDGLDLLSQMGFIDPQKVKIVKDLQEKLILKSSSQ